MQPLPVEPDDANVPRDVLAPVNVTREPFGEIDGSQVERFTFKNASGMEVAILTWGGIIQSVRVPDRSGHIENVTLGFATLDEYVDHSPYFGAIVGRFANRIATGRFELDGHTFDVPVNNGPNALHGGVNGFDRRVWEASVEREVGVPALVLRRVSPDGEEGYPGNLDVSITYRLTSGNGLSIEYRATTDAPTVINLSNHSYFNLAGEGTGDILRHAIQIRASRYTPIDPTLIPTGEIAPVVGTPFDFSEGHIVGERIDQPGDEQLALAGGYDHNFVLDGAGKSDPAGYDVRVIEPRSGRMMDVYTDQPGVQFYTGNFLDGSFSGTSGQIYGHRSGFCLETQHFPDSPNQPAFPSTVLRPGEEFRSVTTYVFSVVENGGRH
jgi:aldose 1-epimerase